MHLLFNRLIIAQTDTWLTGILAVLLVLRTRLIDSVFIPYLVSLLGTE